MNSADQGSLGFTDENHLKSENTSKESLSDAIDILPEVQNVSPMPVVQPAKMESSSPVEIAIKLKKAKVDIGELEKLLELQRQHEKGEAEKYYNTSLSAFKANPPVIRNDRHVNYEWNGTTTSYYHADLGDSALLLSRELGKHGLSFKWFVRQEKYKIEVVCRLTHMYGHFEETSMYAAPDKSGGKNEIQSYISTVTYLKRHTMFAITGTHPINEDDDGRASSTPGAAKDAIERITDKQRGQLMDLINDKNLIDINVLKFFKIKDLSNIPVSQFEAVKQKIKEAPARDEVPQ